MSVMKGPDECLCGMSLRTVIVTQINVDVSSMRPLSLTGKRSHTRNIHTKKESVSHFHIPPATTDIYNCLQRLCCDMDVHEADSVRPDLHTYIGCEYVLNWLQWAVLPSFSGPQPYRKQLTAVSVPVSPQ